MHISNPQLIKETQLAQMATATGPLVATACIRIVSSYCGRDVKLVIPTVANFASQRQVPDFLKINTNKI